MRHQQSVSSAEYAKLPERSSLAYCDNISVSMVDAAALALRCTARWCGAVGQRGLSALLRPIKLLRQGRGRCADFIFACQKFYNRKFPEELPVMSQQPGLKQKPDVS